MTKFELLEDEYYELIKPLEVKAEQILKNTLVKYSNYFKEKFNISHNGYVLLVYNYINEGMQYADNISLYFYDNNWKELNEFYCIYDRYSNDKKEFEHKYRDIDISEFIQSELIEDII